MAIVKGTFATNFSKRLGKVSFANRQGQNIARQRPASVKNPMTEGQQRQRMIFTTVQAAYKKMKPICDHSFESYSYGAKSMARFMKLNLNLLGTQSVFRANFKGNSGCVAPNYYQISEGSLLSPNLAQSMLDDDNVIIAKDIAATGLKDYTVQQALDFFGVSVGQQLSFVAIIAGSNTIHVGDIKQQNACSLQLARVIFKSDATLTAKAFKTIGTDLVLDSANLTTDSKNTNSLVFAEKTTGSTISVTWQFRADYDTMKLFCGAVILSEKQGSSWLRSTENMVQRTSDEDETWMNDQVINTYNPKSAYYLNNATI